MVGILRTVFLPFRRIDADLAEHAFHAERTRLVGDDRHHARADFLVAKQQVHAAHQGHGVGNLAVAGPFRDLRERGEVRRMAFRIGVAATLRQKTAERGAALEHVFDFRRILARVVVRHIGQLVVGNRNLETVAEMAHRIVVEFLLLVRGILRLAGRAHAVTLHGLGQDHGRHVLRVHRCVIRGVDLVRIVAAAIQAPDVVVGKIAHHLQRARILAEEILARVGAAERLAGLVFAVDGIHHDLAQGAVGVAREQRIPIAAPDQFDDIPAGAAERAFEFLDDLAVAAHRAVEALQVAVDDENQVIELLAPGQRDRAQRFGFVDLAVADEAPHLTVGFRHQAAVFQVLPELRLVDRLDRTQAHRHRRHLPVLGHQPRMRIRGQRPAMADHVATKQIHLVGFNATFEERARVDAGTRMALMEDQVARMIGARRAPEMIEADVVQRRRRGEAGDVSAQRPGLAIRAHHHRHRVPADDAADAPFHVRVAGALGLQLRRNRVDVLRGRRERQVAAGAARFVDEFFEQVVRAFGAFGADHGLDGFEPVAGFGRIRILVEHVGQGVVHWLLRNCANLVRG